jgi:hypothetical protein
MATLRELRDTLLTIADPATWLIVADKKLQQFEDEGDDFELLQKHAILKPILEHYVGDLTGWLKFVKGVRDRLEPRTPEHVAVSEFYKTLNVRWIQRRSRAILDVAVDLAVTKGIIDNDWTAKQWYAKRCTQSWKKRKDLLLGAVRKESPTGRVSQSHREELLAAFWQQVADEVNNGEIPPV